ncbi:hypothetical protein ACWGB8_01710 [Kitasatospora sp. NPDC054939]
MITGRVRHAIDLHAHPDQPPTATIDFTSHDIGHTQGTTLSHNGTVIAQYLPGTRYWDRALDIATQNLTKAAERTLAGGQLWDVARFTEHLAAILDEDNCTPWNGVGPDDEEWQ